MRQYPTTRTAADGDVRLLILIEPRGGAQVVNVDDLVATVSLAGGEVRTAMGGPDVSPFVAVVTWAGWDAAIGWWHAAYKVAESTDRRLWAMVID